VLGLCAGVSIQVILSQIAEYLSRSLSPGIPPPAALELLRECSAPHGLPAFWFPEW
jgi:hypothetical protein